jgi:hypothetical protein
MIDFFANNCKGFFFNNHLLFAVVIIDRSLKYLLLSTLSCFDNHSNCLLFSYFFGYRKYLEREKVVKIIIEHLYFFFFFFILHLKFSNWPLSICPEEDYIVTITSPYARAKVIIYSFLFSVRFWDSFVRQNTVHFLSKKKYEIVK